jgi:hypothetical protein
LTLHERCVEVVAVCLPRQLMRVCDELSNASTLTDARHRISLLCSTMGIPPITVFDAPRLGGPSGAGGTAGAGATGDDGIARFRIRVLHTCDVDHCFPSCCYGDGGAGAGAGDS